MATPVHVSVGTNECGGVGFALIQSSIEGAIGTLNFDIDLKIDAVVFNRPTELVLPAQHAAKLGAVEELARQLKANPISGPVGLSAQMLAARLAEILRGDL